MKILFLHGYGSEPNGIRPTVLKESGYEVAHPALPDDDFQESLRIARWDKRGCCIGIRGNANGDIDEFVNISDITYLVDYLFGVPLGTAPPCQEEGNANGDVDELVNISDITYLVDYLFGVPLGTAPPACP